MDVRSKIYDRLSEYYYEYYRITGIYMDDSTIRRIIMYEIGGCINGDEVMYYTSPDKKYKFKIYRTESNLPSYYNINYKITIEVFDGIIGNPVMKMSFNEYACIDILYNIAISPDLLVEGMDNNAIFINPDNSNLNGYMISLTAIFGENPTVALDPNSPMYYKANSSSYDKDIRFEILERSYVYDNLIPMVSMDLTYEELSELAFHIFFATIIDLEFTGEYMDKLEQIEIFVSKYELSIMKSRNTV